MNPVVAQSIGRELNHPRIIDALNEYLDDRIETLRQEMEICKDDRRVHELQGAIFVLRQMYKIREHALAVIEKGR